MVFLTLQKKENKLYSILENDSLKFLSFSVLFQGCITDVSLWYVLKGDSSMICEFDQDEFNTVQWFSFDKIPYENSDPHMRRFIGKLKNLRSSL